MNSVLAIRNWDQTFENNRSRQVDKCRYVLIPNKHDGEFYSYIMAHQQAAEIYAAWVLLLQVASKSPERGKLIRGNGQPHTAKTLSVVTRAPESWFKTAIEFLLKETDWLELQPLATKRQSSDVLNVSQVTFETSDERHPTDQEGNGIEGNGIEKKEGGVGEIVSNGKKHSSADLKSARVCLHFLNEEAGRHFRENDNLKQIDARLREVGYDVDGVKTMIARQCAKWRGTEMADNLSVKCLFRKSNFHNYYDMRDVPLNTTKQDRTELEKKIKKWTT